MGHFVCAPDLFDLSKEVTADTEICHLSVFHQTAKCVLSSERTEDTDEFSLVYVLVSTWS